MQTHVAIPAVYLPDIKTELYRPRLAAATRCFSLFRDGRTSNAGGSANKAITPHFNLSNTRIKNQKSERTKPTCDPLEPTKNSKQGF